MLEINGRWEHLLALNIILTLTGLMQVRVLPNFAYNNTAETSAIFKAI